MRYAVLDGGNWFEAKANLQNAVNVVLARRMGMPGEDRRLKLTAVVWGSIVMTGIAELGSRADWGAVTVDDIVGRIEAAYARFPGGCGGRPSARRPFGVTRW